MFLSRGLRGCTWPPSRGSRHSASLALWSPELHPHGGQLGLKAYVSLYQVPGGTVMPLSWGGLSQSSRGSVSGRTRDNSMPNPLSWTPRPVFRVSSPELSGVLPRGVAGHLRWPHGHPRQWETPCTVTCTCVQMQGLLAPGAWPPCRPQVDSKAQEYFSSVKLY